MLFILWFLILGIMPDADSVKSEEVIYDTTNVVYFGGKNLTYFVQTEKVIIIDSAWVRYREMNLLADSIEYDTKEHLLSAFPRRPMTYVTFKTATETIIGLELHYNVDTRKGMMRKASTEVTNGFFKGEEIWLVKEQTLNVNQGYYTTCDHNPPHYHFYGNRVRVLLGDMVITEPIVLKIGRAPVALAPFWFFPIGKNRKSGLSPFKVGQSNYEGYYAKGISYYWVVNDYSDMTFSLDFMMRRGFYPKVEGRYIVNPLASGELYGTFIREFGSTRNRYSLNAKHRSVFFFATDLEAKIDYQSDDSLISNYAEDRIEWLKRELFSFAQISRSIKRIGRGSLLLQHRKDFTTQTTEFILPKVNIGFYARPIFRTWSISPGISFTNNLKTLGDSAKTETYSANLGLGLAPAGQLDISQSFNFSETKNYLGADALRRTYEVSNVTRRISSLTGFATSQKIFQSLNLTENFSFNEYITLSDSVVYKSEYSFATGSNITLYKIFGIEILGLHGLLHQITPNVSYAVKPQVRQNGFLGIPRFDTIPISTGLSFGLANLFQSKIGEAKIKRDLCFINLGTSYDFLQHKVTPILANGDFFIFQAPNLNLNLNLFTVFNLDSLDFTDYSTNTNFAYSFSRIDSARKSQNNFSINLNHLWSPNSNMVTVNLAFTLPGWAFNITTGSNLRKPLPLADINLSVVKDLHCWELLITGSGMGATWRYDFKLRIKKIPEVSVGKGILNFILP